MLRLVWLTANNAYVFVFGDSLVRMGDEAMFFPTRSSARDAAAAHGLKLDGDKVVADGPNPFA